MVAGIRADVMSPATEDKLLGVVAHKVFSHDMGHGVLLRARKHPCEYEIGTGLAGEDIRARRDCTGLRGDTPTPPSL